MRRFFPSGLSSNDFGTFANAYRTEKYMVTMELLVAFGGPELTVAISICYQISSMYARRYTTECVIHVPLGISTQFGQIAVANCTGF